MTECMVPAPSEDQAQESRTFVLNVSRLVGATSFTLDPGHELRRASAEEIQTIKNMLQQVQPVLFSLPWEVGLATGAEMLPEAAWRYHVVAFQGNNVTLTKLERASLLAPVEIKLGFTTFVANQGLGVTLHPGRLFQQLGGVVPKIDFVEISSAEIEAIKQIHGRLQKHDHGLVDLKTPVEQLLELDAIPPGSPLRFLGFFAILESLLTHSPDPTDRYDSITRQIKKKLTLVNRRCAPSIDYGGFGGTDAEKIWTKMYDYRSRLAHGGVASFDKDLKTLVSADRALKLIRDSVKAVIRQALIEPELIADLRDC